MKTVSCEMRNKKQEMLLFDILKSRRYVSIKRCAAATPAAVFHWPAAFGLRSFSWPMKLAYVKSLPLT